MCAVRERGQLGLRVRKGQKKKGRTWRGPGHWDSCWLSWLNPVTRTDMLQLACKGWEKVVNLQQVGSKVTIQ